MNLKVLKEYKSVYPHPIAFKKGDMVRLGYKATRAAGVMCLSGISELSWQ
jgi:hypothetical protein